MTSGKRFLVVDDDECIAEVISETLKFALDVDSVDKAYNAEEALSRLHNTEYDYLITDQCMPGKKGTTLISEARQIYPSIKALMVTAFADTQLEKELSDLGGIGLLVKPFSINDLIRFLPAN